MAERIVWANSWNVFFHGPTVRHERNKHDLLTDLTQELSGHLFNRKICEVLEKLELKPGLDQLSGNLRLCYERLIALELLESQELNSLEAWLADIEEINSVSSPISAQVAGPEDV